MTFNLSPSCEKSNRRWTQWQEAKSRFTFLHPVWKFLYSTTCQMSDKKREKNLLWLMQQRLFQPCRRSRLGSETADAVDRNPREREKSDESRLEVRETKEEHLGPSGWRHLMFPVILQHRWPDSCSSFSSCSSHHKREITALNHS